MPAKVKKKRPGPAPKAPEDRAVILSTSLPRVVVEWLSLVGNGSPGRGMRAVVTSAHHARPEKKSEILS